MGFKKKYWLITSDTRPSEDAIDITDLVERLQEVDEELWHQEWNKTKVKNGFISSGRWAGKSIPKEFWESWLDEFKEPAPWDNDKPHRIFGSYIDFLNKEMGKKDKRYYDRKKK